MKKVLLLVGILIVVGSFILFWEDKTNIEGTHEVSRGCGVLDSRPELKIGEIQYR